MSHENKRPNSPQSQCGERNTTESEDIEESLLPFTLLYTIFYLILFAILGTLARVGIKLLTSYNGAPIAFSSLWYNFTGCFIMGFLVEDCVVFNYGHWTSLYHQAVIEIQQSMEAEGACHQRLILDMEAAKISYQSKKKTSPLYIGLTTGFCGSLTSFSSFIWDVFLAVANLRPKNRNFTENNVNELFSLNLATTRNFGYSLMAAVAIVILTMSTCISAWLLGVHFAHLLNTFITKLATKFSRKLTSSAIALLAMGSWATIIFLIIYLHILHAEGTIISHGSLLFSLALAPLGCICRFFTSMLLNSKFANFPLGTLTSNLLGTIILGISYDLQRIPMGGLVGCQVLKGVQDGFCGCLTTVSGWIAELFWLKEKFAYLYATVAIVLSLCFLIIVNGSMLWSRGFAEPYCA